MNRTGSNGSSISPENQSFIQKVPKDSRPPPALNSPIPSSSISSPPEIEMISNQSARIPPAAVEANEELHEPLTEESTAPMRKHSSKLLEIELTDDGPSSDMGYEL